MQRARFLRSAIVLKPSTLLHFHYLLINESTACCFLPDVATGPVRKDPIRDVIPAGGSENRAAAYAHFRGGDRKGCCSPYPERSSPAGIGSGRSILAYDSRPHERQSMELRSVPLRIGNTTNLLGTGCDGSVHTTMPDARTPAGTECRRICVTNRFWFVPVADALPRVVPNPNAA